MVVKNKTTKQFYRDLSSVKKPFKEVIQNSKFFTKIPDDWVVVVTDIKGSTRAFSKGKYEEVNIAAASSVIIGINLAKKYKTEIPFIYGGDGATILIPPEMLDHLLEDLATLRANTRKRFGLNLRVGAITVREIHENGYKLKIAKYAVTRNYQQAIFIDSGLYFAERVIKDNFSYQTHKTGNKRPLRLEGLQCRWNVIRPPKNKEEVLCLIVDANTSKNHQKLYSDILSQIDSIYGTFENRHPVKKEDISHTLSIQDLRRESLVKFGKFKFDHIVKRFLEATIERVFKNSKYHHLLALATDTLKVDGTLKTIIAGSINQRKELLEYLETKESLDLFQFGYYAAPSTTMTCFVEPKTDRFVNFLDGTGGGYIQAAKMLKKKLYDKNKKK
ncbi:MAG: hypothetical protein ACI88L_000280 [Candidatus Paceibacteria bacterium]|jgi:hypothetical protein